MDADSMDQIDTDVEHRWVGFADLLGYRNIILGNRPEPDKIRLIRSVYSALIQPIDDINYDESNGDTVGGDRVERIHFSDCFYFISKSAVSLADSMASFFSSAFLLYELTYQGDQSAWTPFLRGGIAGGWTLMFRDPTVPPDRESMFRNPVGPSVAKAFLTGEKQGVSGMRIVTTNDFAVRYKREMESMAGDGHIERIRRLCPAPITERVIDDHRAFLGDTLCEVPWPTHLDFGRWVENFATARSRQFDACSMKHWDATYDLLRRCAQRNGDRLLMDRLNAINPAGTATDTAR